MLFQTHLTFVQALQLSALVPCIFLILYLITSMRRSKLSVVPVLYFFSISAGMLYKLLPALSLPQATHVNAMFPFILADSMMPAFSFLLILQMAFNTVPAATFWSIVLVPVFAMSPFIHAFIASPDVCAGDIDLCFSSASTLHLNRAVVSAFIFMLLTVVFSRRSVELEGDLKMRRNKYWLVICLIIYNIVLISIDIGFAAEFVNSQRYDFAKAMVNIAFIYMIMTSIFRVFCDHFEVTPLNITMSKNPLTDYETSVGVRIKKILEEEKTYRELGFNRASFAKKLGVREHVLSRIINMYFNKSFSELANEYRVAEAKELLSGTEQAVTAIAYDVGFSSITSFNRVFKELTELSASDYRTNNAQQKPEEKTDA